MGVNCFSSQHCQCLLDDLQKNEMTFEKWLGFFSSEIGEFSIFCPLGRHFQKSHLYADWNRILMRRQKLWGISTGVSRPAKSAKSYKRCCCSSSSEGPQILSKLYFCLHFLACLLRTIPELLLSLMMTTTHVCLRLYAKRWCNMIFGRLE